MEQRRRVDVNQCESAVDQLTEKIQNSQKRINRLTGLNVNVNSRNDMLQVFSPTLDDKNKWRTKDGILLPSTPAGKPSINVEALNSINTEESKTILEIRKLLKCRDTFLKGHVMGHQHNGIIHPNINQSTGEVCVNTLSKDWDPQNWSIAHVLRVIRSFFTCLARSSGLDRWHGMFLRAALQASSSA